MTDNSIHTPYRRLILQIFQLWLDDRKRDWSTKRESRVEHEPRKLMYNIKEINYGISKLALKKFREGKRKGDQTKRKAKGGAVQSMYDLTVDAIDEIEIFCYSLILVEHWQNSFHLTCGAIIALESFALESMLAIFDCTLQQPFVPPLPKCLDILPELVNDVPRKEDVDDSTINTPLQQLQHNIQSLISLRWRVCNSSLGPGASGYASGAVSVLGGGGAMSVAPMGFGGSMSVGPLPQQFISMNPSQRAHIAQQNAMMKMYSPAGSVSVYGGSVYGGNMYGGNVYTGSGSVYGGMHTQQMQPIQFTQNGVMPHQHQEEQQRFPISNIILKNVS